MLTIDIKQLVPLEIYYSGIKQLVSYIKNSKKADGTDQIYLPGEIEFLKEKKNLEAGVPMEEQTFHNLNELAKNLGVESLKV